jgi:hypothetical protein
MNVTSRIYIALLHSDIYDRNLHIVNTAISNFDIHDIARCAVTYGVIRYFIVEPLQDQQQLAGKLIDHWCQGYGAEYNPKRKIALSCVKVQSSLAEVVAEITSECLEPPRLIGTDARVYDGCTPIATMRTIIETTAHPYLLLFGTGWGMKRELMQACDYILEPIKGKSNYNHLSVRSAASIILDRLLNNI